MNAWLSHLMRLPRDPAPEEGGAGPADAALVAAARGGDRAAFTSLVERYRARVHALVFNMVRNDADAWDLCQETFLKAWLALPRFEARASFFTWLFRIAHNVTYDFLRRRKPEARGGFEEEWQSGHLAPEAAEIVDSGEAPEAGLARADLRAALERALAQLSPDHRQAILLKEVQGLKYHEIAEVMDCSTGTVMSRLFYARKRLQELLREARADFYGDGE
jgi:RNA polymerase sigma-70 factor, ECF subfamily